MRSNRTLALTALAFLLLSAGSLQAQHDSTAAARGMTLTLDGAIALALEQNRDVLIADQERYKADAQIREAWSGALPTLSLSGIYTRNVLLPVLFLPPNTAFNPSSSTQVLELGSKNSYVGGISLSQTLFNWRVGKALEIAHVYEDYSRENFRATREDVTLEVKKAFYAVLLSRKLVEANRRGLEIVQANAENVKAQFRNGTAAEFDQLRAEVQVANTEPLLLSAENSLALSLNALKHLLALPMDMPLTVEGEFLYEEVPVERLTAARATALTANPSIAALAFQESMLEKNISVERAGHYPTLSLVGAYQFQAQDNTFQFRNYLWAKTFNVGLQLSIPVFDGFKTSARTDQAAIDLQKLHLTRLKAEEGLLIQIQAAELRMEEARKRIAGQQRNVEQAEKAVRIAQTRYRSGVGTQLELLDAQVAMTRTQTNYAQALYDFLVARAEWENAVGASS